MFHKKKLPYFIFLLALMIVVAGCGSSAEPKATQDTPIVSDPTQNSPTTPSNPSTGVYGINSYKFTPASSANFGSGFYTMKEEFLGVGNCLSFGEGFNTLADVLEYEPSAIKIDFSTSIASNRDELLNKLGVGLSLKASFSGGIDIEGEGKYASEKSVNTNKLYLITKANVTGTTFGFMTLGENRVHIQGYNTEDPSKSTGFAKMYLEEYDSFLERCGDKFVSSITIGGEFYLVIEIDTYSNDHKREIEGKLKVDIAGIGGGSAELTAVLNKLKAQSNIKVQLFSSGLFPEPNTLLNAEKDPTATVTNLLNSLKTDCLNLQEKSTGGSKGVNLEGYTLFSLGNLYGDELSSTKFNEDDLKKVLSQLSNCSARVGLTDYKVLTSQSAAEKALQDAKNAIQATYVNSRLLILLSNLRSFVNDANFYIENPSLYENATTPQLSAPKAKEYLDTVVSVIEAKLRRQAALCQLRDYASCKEVSIDYTSQRYNEAKLSKLINTDWPSQIPSRRNQDLPNTCDALHKARGQQAEFSISSEYTIFYNNDLRRSYRVFCIKTPEEETRNTTWLRLGNNPITSNWTSAADKGKPTYLEYLQLINLNNSASAYTNNQSAYFDLDEGTASQVSRYDRIHIDPINLTLVPEVTTYAFNVGEILPRATESAIEAKKAFDQLAPERDQEAPLRMIPYGSTASCDEASPALSYVNLENTPFYLDPIMSRSAAWNWQTTNVDMLNHDESKNYAPSITFTKAKVDGSDVYGKILTVNSGVIRNKCSVITPKDFRIKLTLPIDNRPLNNSLYSSTVSFDTSYSLPPTNKYWGIKLRSNPLLCVNYRSEGFQLDNCTIQSPSQTWHLKLLSGDRYRISRTGIEECLTVTTNADSNDIKSEQCTTGANANQEWRVTPQGNGNYQFRWLQNPNLCLSVSADTQTATTGDSIKLLSCAASNDLNFWKLSERPIPDDIVGATLQLTLKDIYVTGDCDSNTAAGNGYANLDGNVTILGGKHGDNTTSTIAQKPLSNQSFFAGQNTPLSLSSGEARYYYDNRIGTNRMGIDIQLEDTYTNTPQAFVWQVPFFDFSKPFGTQDAQGRSVNIIDMTENSTVTGQYQYINGLCDMTLTYEIYKGSNLYQ